MEFVSQVLRSIISEFVDQTAFSMNTGTPEMFTVNILPKPNKAAHSSCYRLFQGPRHFNLLFTFKPGSCVHQVFIHENTSSPLLNVLYLQLPALSGSRTP
jgi:hypothetical protein